MVNKLKKILIVDDDIEIGNLIQGFFDPDNYYIHKEIDGISGIQALKEIKPDIVLLDIKMPLLDGFKFLEYMEVGNFNIPTVVITGSYEFDMEPINYNVVKTIITKPFNESDILECVNMAFYYNNIEKKVG